MSYRKNIFLALSAAVVFSALAFIVAEKPQTVVASGGDNVSGWGWSSNIGWVSFNSTGCDTDGNGFIDSGACGSDNLSIPVVNYGVNIDASGNFSGYAWSPSIGWISFNPSDLAPSASGCTLAPCAPTFDWATKSVTGGWARALTPISNGGGWDGWISLAGVKLDGTSTYAWGADVIGWLDFSRVSIASISTLKICQNSCTSMLRRDTGAMASFAMGTGAADARTLYACLGTGSCDGDDIPVANASWGEVSSSPYADVVDRTPLVNPTSSITITGKATGEEKITVSDGINTAEAVATVTCVPVVPACDPAGADAQNTCTGQQYGMTYVDNCTGASVTQQCDGARYCDYNWKEVAP